MYSQTAEYALRAMASLSVRPAHLMPTCTLAEATKVPPNYLAKVLQQLAGAGLLTGRRGVGGGYRLARNPREISLLEVINAVSPISRLNACPLGLPDQGPELCALHRKTDQAAAAAIEIFKSSTLADLVADAHQDGPLCGADSLDSKVTVQGASADH